MKKYLMLASALSILSLGVGCAATVYEAPIWTSALPGFGSGLAVVLALLAVALLAAVVVKAAPARVVNRSRALRSLLALAFGAAVGSASAGSVLTDGVGGALFAAVLPYLLTAAGTFAVAGLGYAASFLKGQAANVKNETLRNALFLLDTLVFEKVTEIFNHAVATLKAGASDGKLTPEEAQAALAAAVTETWAALPALIKKLLAGIAGGELAAQSAFVAPKVEVAVKNVNSLGLHTLSIDRAPTVRPTTAAVTAARLRLGLGLKPGTYAPTLR